MGVGDQIWGEYPVYYKQPLRVCTKCNGSGITRVKILK